MVKENGEIKVPLTKLNTTQYYEEFLRYFEMCSWQHEHCNLGTVDYMDTPYDDDLIKHVHLYDVCERRYAGFTQLILDMWHNEKDHPYAHKMSNDRRSIVNSIETDFWGEEEWFFVFFVHRLTGSGINYSKNPSGYHNSILLHFGGCETIEDMVEVIKNYEGPKFTSSGYQIAPFPKPQGDYEKGGDWFICEQLPKLVRLFLKYLKRRNGKTDFRHLMSWLEGYNQSYKFRVFRFQYGAVLADIADFFPQYIDLESPFFYGKNAMECLEYMAVRPKGQNRLKFLDSVMERIQHDTGSLPYNAEDIACDCIRWIENYVNPKADYSHLDMDKIWSSHKIYDHPYGRQKAMLELGLVDTFNGKGHPSDDKIIKEAGMTAEEYRNELL